MSSRRVARLVLPTLLAMSSLLSAEAFTSGTLSSGIVSHRLASKRRIRSDHLPLQGSMIGQIMKERPKKVVGKSSTASSRQQRSKTPIISADFLANSIEEALYRQGRILEALDEQDQNIPSVSERRNDVQRKIGQLRSLKERSFSDDDDVSSRISALKGAKKALVDLGFASILKDPTSWRKDELGPTEFGRPSDFDGLVLYSPSGVPILVGKKGAHNDDVLRRISQGSDLWFQVEDYGGSRVLLRTSLMRGLKNSRSCMQTAANLAAYYSDYRDYANIAIMYTDSKRVAKRGSKRGQMRRKKSLGRMYGNPHQVSNKVRGREP